jgi:anti-anti-sigma factor
MDQEFNLTSERRGNRLVMVTSGYVNNVGGEAIAREFDRHFNEGVRQVVVSLAGSKVVNSIGMSFLLEILEKLQDTGGKLVFTNLDPPVDKMLTIMGIFSLAGKAATVDEAMKLFT